MEGKGGERGEGEGRGGGPCSKVLGGIDAPVKHGIATLIIIMILKDSATFQAPVLFRDCLFFARNRIVTVAACICVLLS